MKTRTHVISLLVLASWTLGSLTASGRAGPPQSDALLRTLMHAIADLRRQIENISAKPGPPGPAGPVGPAGPRARKVPPGLNRARRMISSQAGSRSVATSSNTRREFLPS